jgi:hypothetical protein
MTAPIATEQRNDLYWAVVEHVRTWLRDDGPFIQEIKRGNGALNGRTLRRIATTYKVSRGIPRGGADGDTHAEALARLINDTNWPSELVPRAKVCANLAREANEKRYTHGIQTSAITKFSWFAQPLGWTPYDTFTARAMGFRGARAVCSMVSFYAELQQRGFSELAEQVQSLMDSRQIMALHGTRVLDKLMMLTGADSVWAGDLRSLCREFLQVLPRDWREAVEEVAGHVTEQVNLGRFLSP